MELEQNADRIRTQGLGIVAISYDSIEATRQFTERMHISFPLLSDPNHAIAEAWGAWGEKTRGGTTFEDIIRSSFLVDESGRIGRAWYAVKPKDTVPNALAALST